MKIICDNCGAKYSIADEKVKGKVFKIRCKKCQESIVIRGDAPSPEPTAPEPAAPEPAPAPSLPPMEDGEEETKVFDYSGYQSGASAEESVWHVAVDGGEQQGPYTTSQLGEYIAGGNIDYETFIWREGFTDWKAIREVEEVMSVIAPASEAVAEPAGAPAAVAGGGLFDAAPEPAAGGGGGGLFDAAPEPAAGGGGGGLFDAAPEPAAGGGSLFDAGAEPAATGGGGLFDAGGASSNPGDVFSSAPAADTSTGGLFSADQSAQGADALSGGLFDGGHSGGSAGDLFSDDDAAQDGGGIFASTEAPGSPRVSADQALMTGQRNENSVLFSLSNLQALASGGQEEAAAPSFSIGGGESAPVASTSSYGSGEEASGLIDIRAMASSLNAEAQKASDVDDMLALGGGGFAPTLGAPVLAAAAPSGMSLGMKIGIAVGAVMLLAAIVVGVVIFIKGPDTSAQDQKIAALMQQLEEVKKSGGSAADLEALQTKLNKAQTGGDDDEAAGNNAAEGATPESSASAASAASTKKRSSRSSKSSKSSSSSSSKSDEAEASAEEKKPAASPKKHDALDDLLGGSPTKKPAKKKPVEKKPAAASGKLSRSQVISGMNAVKSSVSRCGAGQSGSVKIRATISPVGRVTNATATGTFAGTPAGSCAARAVKRAKFPKAGQPTTVTYPFKF